MYSDDLRTNLAYSGVCAYVKRLCNVGLSADGSHAEWEGGPSTFEVIKMTFRID